MQAKQKQKKYCNNSATVNDERKEKLGITPKGCSTLTDSYALC